MQSKENAWTYLALKQAKEMALQLLHLVAGYWFWQKKKTMATLVLASFPCFFLFSSLLFSSFSFLPSFSFFLFSQLRTETPVLRVLSARLWLFFLLFSLCFSLLFMLFLSAFLFLKAGAETDQDDRC
jgi:hypothetical protein